MNEGGYGLSFDPPLTNLHVPLSSPIFSEQKTMPLALIAWEKTGHRSRGIGSADFGYGVHCGDF